MPRGRKVTACFKTSLHSRSNRFLILQYKPPLCEIKAKAGDKVLVHYRGTLADGKQFDASYDRGDPLDFTLGAGQVIQGWDKVCLLAPASTRRNCTLAVLLSHHFVCTVWHNRDFSANVCIEVLTGA